VGRGQERPAGSTGQRPTDIEDRGSFRRVSPLPGHDYRSNFQSVAGEQGEGPWGRDCAAGLWITGIQKTRRRASWAGHGAWGRRCDFLSGALVARGDDSDTGCAAVAGFRPIRDSRTSSEASREGKPAVPISEGRYHGDQHPPAGIGARIPPRPRKVCLPCQRACSIMRYHIRPQ
jgi:hypothetical protein